MSFWKYCEKLSGFVGQTKVMKNINRVYGFWYGDYTIEQCLDELKKGK